MSINRIHKTRDFSVIDNAALRDKRLSYRARGILAMVLSHTDGFIDGYHSSSLWIAANGIEGRDAVRKALAELEQHGYRRVNKYKDAFGRFVTEVHWSESPGDGIPGPENPTSVG